MDLIHIDYLKVCVFAVRQLITEQEKHARVRAVNFFCLDRLVNIQYVHRNRPLTSAQLEKLIEKFLVMISALAARKDLRLHANIDQFYYMQKLVELRLLVTILNGAKPDETLLHQKIHAHYRVLYCTWKKDVRYLGRYIRTTASNLTPNPIIGEAV